MKVGKANGDLIEVFVPSHSVIFGVKCLVLEGRLRDSLKAKTGFAPIYLEIDLAQRSMDSGYDVEFLDIEGSAQYDLLFRRGSFVGEVECKSLSADAGRQIHRKDFYRFMEAITPALGEQAELKQQEVLVVSLDARLLAWICMWSGRSRKYSTLVRTIHGSFATSKN